LPGAIAGPFRSSITPVSLHQSPICSLADEICVEKGRDAGERAAPEAGTDRFDMIWAV
jgi:hypothetical protein